MQENDGIEASNKANFGNLDNLNEKHFYGTSEMHLYWNSLSPLLWCPRAENMSVGCPRMLEFHLIYKSTFKTSFSSKIYEKTVENQQSPKLQLKAMESILKDHISTKSPQILQP